MPTTAELQLLVADYERRGVPKPYWMRRFCQELGELILGADDPEAALRRLLGKAEPRRSRGRLPEDNADRDVRIAAYVAELQARGMPLRVAYEEARARLKTPIDVKRVEQIYYQYAKDDAVLAVRETVALEAEILASPSRPYSRGQRLRMALLEWRISRRIRARMFDQIAAALSCTTSRAAGGVAQ